MVIKQEIIDELLSQGLVNFRGDFFRSLNPSTVYDHLNQKTCRVGHDVTFAAF